MAPTQLNRISCCKTKIYIFLQFWQLFWNPMNISRKEHFNFPIILLTIFYKIRNMSDGQERTHSLFGRIHSLIAKNFSYCSSSKLKPYRSLHLPIQVQGIYKKVLPLFFFAGALLALGVQQLTCPQRLALPALYTVRLCAPHFGRPRHHK